MATLSKLSGGEIHGELSVVNTLKGGWRLEGIIEPREQVAINERLLPQQRHHLKVLFIYRLLVSTIPIRAVRICVSTAFSVVPTNVLIFIDCFRALKESLSSR